MPIAETVCQSLISSQQILLIVNRWRHSTTLSRLDMCDTLACHPAGPGNVSSKHFLGHLNVLTPLVHAMQSIVIHLRQLRLMICFHHETDRLCYREQIDAIHIDAKPLQPCLQRRRARNDAHAQGLLIILPHLFIL